MRKFIVILIMIFFSYVAYSYKNRFKIKIKIIDEIVQYINFYKTNIAFYKDDLEKINLNYNIMQENKNANYIIFTLKNNSLQINNAKINKYLDKLTADYILQYFQNMGSQLADKEVNISDDMIKHLTKIKEEIVIELKNKGELWFKIILMVGAIISIIIW